MDASCRTAFKKESQTIALEKLMPLASDLGLKYHGSVRLRLILFPSTNFEKPSFNSG